ncbi:MAG: gamma-glutamyltransferase [Proteobacteria bacterium]|nr:gamma-glutamyltransferase [Pseudomonadota bacterium]
MRSRPHSVQNLTIRKPGAGSAIGGVISGQAKGAMDIGAEILAQGGNAVDAAVAASFALATAEPWNSGLGGIGFLMFRPADTGKVQVIDFGPQAPARLDPKHFPLTGRLGGDLFGWPEVEGNRNVHGPLSIAVPGQVDGMALALERFGTLPWEMVLEPAARLADRGLPIDFWTTLKVAAGAKDLHRYPSSRDIYLRGGFPPTTESGTPQGYLGMGNLAATIRRLQLKGPRDFYEGAIAADIADDAQALGGVLTREDLASYHARLVEPHLTRYRGAEFACAPVGTAGPTLARVLQLLEPMLFRPFGADAASFVAYADALRQAYTERLAGTPAASGPATSTTHLNVVDRHGNVVALTQTLLSSFGSRLVLPRTGILMNNGIMWFDPRPGRPNSIAPGKRPLTNMCPTIVSKDGKGWIAVGASGGRRILPSVAQLLSFIVDHGMDLDTAFHHPRIDVSGGDAVEYDPRLPIDVQTALAARFQVRAAEHTIFPASYACPSAILIDPATGGRTGMSDTNSPWSASISV